MGNFCYILMDLAFFPPHGRKISPCNRRLTHWQGIFLACNRQMLALNALRQDDLHLLTISAVFYAAFLLVLKQALRHGYSQKQNG